ncbi:hypothetical protein Dimus_027006 [Dionaea muscipula]
MSNAGKPSKPILQSNQIVKIRQCNSANSPVDFVLQGHAIELRSNLKEFFRSESVIAIREVSEGLVEHKLLNLEFLVCAFAIINDAESCLALRNHAPIPCENWKDSSEEEDLSQLKGDAAALRVGTAELQSMLLKGGGVLTLLKMSNLMLRRFSSKLLLDAAKCQIENGFIRKGLAGVASRYLGLRSLMSFLGPLLLGTFLADIAIVMLGTDYARVLQAIYTFAQIRILRTYRQLPEEDSI